MNQRDEGDAPTLWRRGPHPLPLYLSVASRLQRQADAPSDTVFEAFIDGLKSYWRQPGGRPAPTGEPVWRRGPLRLLGSGPAGGPPVLVVPSLVNRAYILDLMPERSLVAALATTGHRVLLVDWGEPGDAELSLGIADHLARHLEPALRLAAGDAGRPPVLLGYCMGGLLSLALAAQRPREIAGLALLATPWDFSFAGPGQCAPAVAAAALADTLARFGHVPANLLDWTFAAPDPEQVVAKYSAFGRGDPRSLRGRIFVAIEDWLADGVALAGPVARECLHDWYIDNLPASGDWRVDGRIVRPEALDVPAFVAVPSRDRIVPEASARPLARLLRRAVTVEPAAGHVGMVAGGRAPELLWRPLLGWLRRIADATE
ncbi:MAG TPA: alpha/beta fold hydrolase [Geminicoccaceae bacterium]|nr:alpha/beta fold hydrolase [Geminicoccus sp.]HMU50027.1 alpha/beta fold hydrolase [Geminicoccaceae bacterium]